MPLGDDGPLFLERASFRRRRMGDAARVLPILALIVTLVPVWWLPDAVSGVTGMVWAFVLWAALIVAIAVLHRALIRADAAAKRAETEAATKAGTPSEGAPRDAL